MTVANLIRQRREKNQSVLIGYFPAGYPTVAESIEVCVAMCENGVDILELGVPYSDPVMDGLVIQEATETALKNGFRLRMIPEIVAKIREQVETPILVMSYWNPVIQYGVSRFAEDLRNSGAQGLITPDLIPDEAKQWLEESDRLGLDRVFMATPSSSPTRLTQAAKLSRGFVYGVSTMGITGTREDLDANARAVVAGVRASGAETPVCVGIGISNPTQVSEVLSYADGAIVGSAIIKAYRDSGISGLVDFVRELKAGAK
ncbi:MAG: tryptophan synthase subunit alpha [Microbacteriaceae bacterium]|nr:tryptophan synthase subunit alpha [Microbacteriaceae bacterium]